MRSGTFWRRRFGAAVLAPAVLALDTLAPRKGAGHIGAEEGRWTLWRRRRAPDTLAPRAGASNTTIRPPSPKKMDPPKKMIFLDVSSDFRGENIFFFMKKVFGLRKFFEQIYFEYFRFEEI